jgi:glycosyltransferase involved in cell wall biosynthesis
MMSIERPDITVFFPVYNDAFTVRTVTEKAIQVCEEVAGDYEIIIINDGSPDNSGKIADELAAQYPRVKVVHHPANLGYGAAVKTGLREAKYELIFFTDGDDEYDMRDFRKLLLLKDYYDHIITFRYKKIYQSNRIFISYIYNVLLRWMFRTSYRDISSGMRMVKKSVASEVKLTADSPFIGAELTIKIMLKGYRVGEVGIQTFPRQMGSGASTSLVNIIATIKDMFKVYREIFSDEYELPDSRHRKGL